MLDFIMFLFVIGYPIFMIVDLIKKHKQGQKIGKRLGIELIIGVVAFFALAIAVGNHDASTDSSSNSSNTTKVAKRKNTSKNIPGQKINKSKATKHEFYWTSKSDSKIRYFVDDDKKITAIKVVLKPEVNNTWWCQSYMEKILHDDNLKYGNDKQGKNDAVLSNKVKYNIYSPKYKKWYWVNFDAADGKNMVATFSIYPGKNKDAE